MQRSSRGGISGLTSPAAIGQHAAKDRLAEPEAWDRVRPALTAGLLSLAGFPPLVGFVGKTTLLLEAAFSGGFATPHRTEALAADGRATAVASVAAVLTLLLGVLPAWGLRIAT